MAVFGIEVFLKNHILLGFLRKSRWLKYIYGRHRFRQKVNIYASFEAFVFLAHTLAHMSIASFINQLKSF